MFESAVYLEFEISVRTQKMLIFTFSGLKIKTYYHIPIKLFKREFYKHQTNIYFFINYETNEKTNELLQTFLVQNIILTFINKYIKYRYIHLYRKYIGI